MKILQQYAGHLLIALVAILCLGCTSHTGKKDAAVQPGTGQPVITGAIRWDGWVGPLHKAGLEVEHTLSPHQYHYRAPFYSRKISADSIQCRGITQEIMDKEISYAKYAGLDYWAFCWYPPHSGLDTARQLYLASLHKSDVKWCVILGTNPFDYDTDGPWLVKRFGASNYQKVADGRPLVYLFTSPDAKGYEIARLRRLTADAGLPDPYVVVMAFSAAHADSIATHEKADAISCYASSYNFKTGGQYDGAAYDAVAGSDRAGWEKYKATGRAVVPWVTTGWSPRPRIDRSVSWGAYYKSNGWAQDATPAGIAENLQNARDWVGSNKVAAKAGVVLMYAWNEFDEGGWICPTLGDSTHRLDAIRQVLKR